MLWGPSRHLGSLTAANWVSFDFNVSYSSCWGYSLINTFKLKKWIVPRRSEDPLVLVPLVPLRSEDPLHLVPLVPRLQLVPTCPNLSHLVVPLVLCQLSFLRFFFVFLSVIPSCFSKNSFECQVFFKVLSCWRGYKWQPNFHEKTGDNHDHTLEHMGIFFLEFNSSVLWLQHTKNS